MPPKGHGETIRSQRASFGATLELRKPEGRNVPPPPQLKHLSMPLLTVPWGATTCAGRGTEYKVFRLSHSEKKLHVLRGDGTSAAGARAIISSAFYIDNYRERPAGPHHPAKTIHHGTPKLG